MPVRLRTLLGYRENYLQLTVVPVELMAVPVELTAVATAH